MKFTSMMDNKTYVSIIVQEFFAVLKAYEYELERMGAKSQHQYKPDHWHLLSLSPRARATPLNLPQKTSKKNFAMLMRKMRRFLKKKDFSRRFHHKKGEWK